jgi:hypothetical protein
LASKMGEKKICLGDEYDNRLREALMVVLLEMDASVHKQMHGIGGSQEVEISQANINGRRLAIEAETYIGLSISGDDELVDEIARRVRGRLGRSDA